MDTGRHLAARSPRRSLLAPSLRRPARRVVILAALSVATFACSPQGPDAPATAEAPATAAAAQEVLTPLEGFTVKGESLDETTSGPGVRSWVEVDAELDGDLVSAPPDEPTGARPPSPAPSTRPAVPDPRQTSSSPAASPMTIPTTPSTTLPTPATRAPVTDTQVNDTPSTDTPSVPAPDSTTSTTPAPDPTAILASADAVIASALEDGVITAGTAVALSAKVDTALAALATGGPVTSACGNIGALLGLLSAQDGKDVPVALAEQLIAAALAASAALAC